VGALGGLRELLRPREGADTSPGSAPLRAPRSSASLGYPDPRRGSLGAGGSSGSTGDHDGG
jgi:hypothetical protein